ncbi:MAG TPA: hypothetical protein VFK04_18065 [Gemmatimonadaceae bacterium]|nr:hypothetical protein [Gemmatimonadaceae bacterium]
MRLLRVRTLAPLLVLVILASSCERMSVGPEIAGELRDGRAYATALISEARDAAPGSVAPSTAIALGYLERHRLGLGSPFRLIDYALRDPRLDDSTRQAVAWALLARTMDGDGASVEPAALDSLDAPAPLGTPIPGSTHLALVEKAVREAHDPRAGELAVRLAYAFAAAEHRVRASAPLTAASAAALVRDRELAREDARDLLREAWVRGEDPLRLLVDWRVARRFRVEQPVMEPLPPGSELEAMKLAPRLAARIKELGTEERSDESDPAREESSSLLGAAAWRLAQVARATDAPPQTPVVVSLATNRGQLLGSSELSRAERNARSRFLKRTTNEEQLVAEHALVERAAPGESVARTTLTTAIALRAYAQETPWFQGDSGPTPRQLYDTFGLASVTFDPGTREAWKPYYLTMLATALRDLERVVPSLDLTGLHVRFGESPMHDLALALHDPRQRTIYLPLATGAGTIAHEIAHDIDWQAARTRYAVRGDYATDLAVRDKRRSRLAASMRGLRAASPVVAEDGLAGSARSARPTEVFARGLDWFVAVSLAHEGRIDGYLSSVQDDLLTGYVTVTPPDVTGQAGSALVGVLDDVAPPGPGLRDWFLTRYGPQRSLTPYDLVRRVLEAPLDSEPAADSASVETLERLVRPVARARDEVLALVDAGSCRPGEARDDREIVEARRRLVEFAAKARATGIMRERGSVIAAPETWRWAAVAPYTATQPFLFDDALRNALVGELAARAEALDNFEPSGDDAPLRSGVYGCSAAES